MEPTDLVEQPPGLDAEKQRELVDKVTNLTEEEIEQFFEVLDAAVLASGGEELYGRIDESVENSENIRELVIEPYIKMRCAGYNALELNT